MNNNLIEVISLNEQFSFSVACLAPCQGWRVRDPMICRGKCTITTIHIGLPWSITPEYFFFSLLIISYPHNRESSIVTIVTLRLINLYHQLFPQESYSPNKLHWFVRLWHNLSWMFFVVYQFTLNWFMIPLTTIFYIGDYIMGAWVSCVHGPFLNSWGNPRPMVIK